jgi:hypothetical protein
MRVGPDSRIALLGFRIAGSENSSLSPCSNPTFLRSGARSGGQWYIGSPRPVSSVSGKKKSMTARQQTAPSQRDRARLAVVRRGLDNYTEARYLSRLRAT